MNQSRARNMQRMKNAARRTAGNNIGFSDWKMARRSEKKEKKEKKGAEQSGKKSLAVFSGLDERKKRVLEKLAGLLSAAFAVFTFLALFSYLFTWKADSSLLTDPQMFKESAAVGNWAGKLGCRWAFFLVSDCFGLGAFAIVYFFAASSARASVRQDGHKLFPFLHHIPYRGVRVLAAPGFHIDLAGQRTLFGGGLGGDCGDVATGVLANLTGNVVTFPAYPDIPSCCGCFS